MSIRRQLACIVIPLLVTAGGVHAAHGEPLRIFYFNWAGFGPFFLAQDKGFFADEGIEVDLINVEETYAAYAGLAVGHVDAVAAIIQDVPYFSTPDDILVCALVTDDSSGADGIVANKDIRAIADLKGKTVAFEKGSGSRFYLNVVLHEAGLTEADIVPVDIPDADAATAFLLQEVDALSTWGAMLIEARQAPHGHLLTDSSEQPGTIIDCLITTRERLGARRSDFRALGRAWDAAVHYVEAHPDEAVQIMAERMGGAHGDPEVFAEVLNTIRLYDEQRNHEYFGTQDQPGQIYQTAQIAIDVWSRLGELDFELTPADVIAHDVWEE